MRRRAKRPGVDIRMKVTDIPTDCYVAVNGIRAA